MNLTPLHDRIIVKRIKGEDVSAGGILLSDPEKPDECEVVAVGPEALAVKIGDRVILGKKGVSVKVGGASLLVVREEDVFAVVE